MDPKLELGMWMLSEARLSFKYWHSSATLRGDMKNPFFDRTQCEWILKNYREEDEVRLA
jgi:hypothetical protein